MSLFRRVCVALVLVTLVGRVTAADIEFHFVYVGQGDCTLIKTPDGKNVLVDCGSSRDGEPEEVRSYIQSQIGANGSIDVLVITHPDSDHYNLVPDVLQGITVERVLYVGTLNEYPEADFDRWLRNHPNKRRLRNSDADQPGHSSPLFPQGDVRFQILAADVGDEKNTRSIVLMVSYGEFDAVLTGDATAETETDILSRFAADDLDAELLKIGHHGSTTSTTDRWLQAVRPETATVSAAYNSQYAHPRRAVIDRVSHFTNAAPSHRFRWGIGSGNDARLRNVNDFREAIFSTATSGSFRIRSNGTNVESFHDTDEDVPTPFALTANPRVDTPNRRLISPLASRVAAAPITDSADGLRRTIGASRAAAAETPQIAPVTVGKPIELTLRSGAKVSGMLKVAPNPTWYQVIEDGTSKAVLVREADVAMIKQ